MIEWDLKQKQTFNIAAITFWSQFAVYTFNAVLILYLTKSVVDYGLGFTQKEAYAFQGVSQAMGYTILMIGGFVADKFLGIRRSILIGSTLVALAFFLVFISGFFVHVSNLFFIAAYALIPAASSLMLGTTSGLVSKIHQDDSLRAKGAMTIFYISINLGSIIAFMVAPALIHYKYGPLSILAIVAVGKLISAANFGWRYKMYDNVVEDLDKNKLKTKTKFLLVGYLVLVYLVTLTAYSFPDIASYILGFVCLACILYFIFMTALLEGETRIKQFMGIILILVAVAFFVIYNQMNSTLVLCAEHNSNLMIAGFKVFAASFQMVNPIIIIIGGYLISHMYKKLPHFNIPLQFALGMFLAGLGLLAGWFGFTQSTDGLINGNYLVLTYFFISISELFISAIGLSMIGLYCDIKTIGLAMGAWYMASALSNVLTGQINQLVALPDGKGNVEAGWHLYQTYFLDMGLTGIGMGVITLIIAILMIKFLRSKNIKVA